MRAGWQPVEITSGGEPLPLDAFCARSRQARMHGLLGIEPLPERLALILRPAYVIHMIGMQSRLDLIFFNRRGRVLRLCRAHPGAHFYGFGHGCVELAPGLLPELGLARGDQLSFRPLEAGGAQG